MIVLGEVPAPVGFWLAGAPPQADGDRQDHENEVAPGMRSLRVLIVEDEFFISLDTKAQLEAMGHTVVGIAVSADQAVMFADRERPDVVLMDIRLIGPRDGIEAAGEICTRFGIGSIFVTANSDPGTRHRAQAVQPVAFLEKPLTQLRLRTALGNVHPL